MVTLGNDVAVDQDVLVQGYHDQTGARNDEPFNARRGPQCLDEVVSRTAFAPMGKSSVGEIWLRQVEFSTLRPVN